MIEAPPPSAGPIPGPRARIAVCLVFAVLWFGGLGYRDLAKPDEGRYAEIPREMALSGDWVTPRLNGIKYFEKPPLQYWATAVAYGAFGPSAASARLWTALTGFAGVVLVYFAGAALFGASAGWFAALALASNPYYFLLGHINTLDMGLAFFCGVGLCAFLLGERPTTAPFARSAWMAIAWIALALGVLTKGLVAVVLPGATVIAYVFLQRDWRILARLRPIVGGVLLVAVCAPWFVAVSRANPEFARFFFIHEHFERFATTVHRRVEPFWFFLPVVAVGMLPWLWGAIAGIRRAFEPSDGVHPLRFLTIWCTVVLAFFSLSQSKLPAYVLPMFPALALLAGAWLARAPQARAARSVEIQGLLLALLFAVGAWFVARAVHGDEQPYHERFAWWLWAAAILVAAGVAMSRALRRRGASAAAWSALALFAAAGIQTGQLGYQAMSPVQSAAALVEGIRGRIPSQAPFYSVGTYDQTLDFYLGRTVTVVAFQDELEFGLRQQPELWLPTLDDFRRAWLAAPAAGALMEPGTFESLRASGLPMREIARDTRRVIVARP